MLYHAATGQYFSSKSQAQSALKQLSPILEDVTVNDPGPPIYDEATQRLVRNQTLSGAVRTVSYTVEDLTQEEIDAKVEAEVDQAAGVDDASKALGLVLADMWLNITTGKFPPGVGPSQNQATQQQMQTARQQVRNRLETYIRDLKGF